MDCSKPPSCLKVLQAVTFIVCISLFVYMSWGIFAQYSNKSKVKLESQEEIEQYQYPQIVLCPAEPYLEGAEEFLTPSAFRENAVDIREHILVYQNFGNPEPNDWEVKEVPTLYDGKCRSHRYTKKVRATFGLYLLDHHIKA